MEAEKLFREHRGTLEDSMATVVTINNRDELVSHIADKLTPFGIDVKPEDVQVSPYAKDERIDWDTYIVTLQGYGVVGFTNCLL
jgi:hypothetical protein